FSTHDDEDKEEESFDPIVQTHSHDEKTDDEDHDEDSHGMNVEGDKMDDEGANEEMTLMNYIETSTAEFVCVISICFKHAQPKSRYRFDHQLKALEINFSEFMQTNQFAEAISLIPGIVDKYLDHRMNEAVKMESNKSIHRFDEQKNLYKALVDAYEWVQEKTSWKKPESTSEPKEKTSKTTGKSTEGSKSHHKSASESTPAEEPMHTTKDLEEPVHQEFDTDTLTPELLSDPTYELMKGSCKSLVELEFFLEEVYKATTDQLDWNNPKETMTSSINSKKAISKGFAFKTLKTCFFSCIVIQRRTEDLQLGVKIYQKKINLTKPDTYRSNLKRKEAYTAYSNPRGFIYQNKDKQNRLMCIDEIHKFSDDTLNDVWTALDDRLKGIWM
nr:hypothetical protein [Tanacetum cinerariifolium]